MPKLTALAALAAALLVPAAAPAASGTTLHGVVVAKQGARHILVVASPRGTVTAARVTAGQLRTTRLGSRLALAGTRLPDGSLHSTRLTVTGTATRARLRVTVLRARGTKLLVAGGGAAFAIRLTGRTRTLAASAARFAPGEQIRASVALGKDGPVGATVQAVGDSVLIDFDGTITASDATSVTLSTDSITTVVTIPGGITLPALVQVGDEVEIVASVSGATLTLVEIKIDSEGDDGGSSVGGDSSVEVHGSVTAIDASSITIQPGDAATPVTLAIPVGFTLPGGLTTGSRVEAKGDVVSGVLTLTKLELKGSHDGGGDGSGDRGGDGDGGGGGSDGG
jgi:hypothetical protein